MIVGLALLWFAVIPVGVLSLASWRGRYRSPSAMADRGLVNANRETPVQSCDGRGYLAARRTIRAREICSEPAPAQHVRNGSQHDLDIEPQRPIRPIEIVDLDHLLHGDA